MKSYSKNKWCPYCSHNKLCNYDSGDHCFKHSFASNEKAKFWINAFNKRVTPRKLFLNSVKKYWFKCEKGHEFDILNQPDAIPKHRIVLNGIVLNGIFRDKWS